MDIKSKPMVRLRLDTILSVNGWTQKELAEKSGISENGIGVLRKAKMIRYETLGILVDITGWPIERLLEYVPSE